MNKQLTREEMDGIVVSLTDFFGAPTPTEPKRKNVKFSKSEAGRQRRNIRKARIAEKMAWLNS